MSSWLAGNPAAPPRADRAVLPEQTGIPRPVGGTGAQWAARFPPRPVAPSWPRTRAPRTEVLTRLLAAPFVLDNASSQQTRRLGLLTVMSWLQAQAGHTWQQRWAASGAETVSDWRDLVTRWAIGRGGAAPDASGRPPHIGPGLLVLICGEIIRPGLPWLATFAPARRGLAEEMARTRDTAAFTQLPRCAAIAGCQRRPDRQRSPGSGSSWPPRAEPSPTSPSPTAWNCWRSPTGWAPNRTAACTT